MHPLHPLRSTAGHLLNGRMCCSWDSDFVRAAGHVISPPLRSKPHQLALRNALAGGILQLVGTGGAAMTGYSAMTVHSVFETPGRLVGTKQAASTACSAAIML